MGISKYSARPASTWRLILADAVYIIMATCLNWIVYVDNRELEDRFTCGPSISLLFVPLLNLILSYQIAVRVYEFTRMMTYVQVGDTGVIRMRNLWKKEVEVRAERIVQIEPVWPLPLTSGWKHLALVDESGYKHIIHHNIEPLGECMEAIRKICPNLKSVDYSGLDKHGLWTIRGKM